MKDRFQGALVGLAVGDALGFPVEFIGSDEIRRRHGPRGVTDFEPSHSHPKGSYTDDTQMSLAIANALTRAGEGSLDQVMAAVGEELIAWATSPDNNRAPGSTTMSACRRLAAGRPWRDSGIPESKGCGSAIRTAPIGLYYHNDRGRLMEVGAASSLATHGHACAVAGAQANALAVALALEKTPLEEILAAITESGGAITPEFSAKLSLVPDMLALPPDGAFDQLGDAWVAEEAMACAMYCFMRSPEDYRAAVLTAANASGDSDSIACIAGGISGAYNGLAAVPDEWVKGVENSAGLLETAERLCEAAG